MSFEKHKRLLHEVAARDIPTLLETWPTVHAGLHARRRSARRQHTLQIAAVAVVLLTLAAGTILSTTGSDVVSAEALLDRAGAVGDGLAGGARPYHITATTTFHPAESGFVGPSVQQEETWFGGPGRMRQEVHTPDWTTVTVSNGTQSWWTVTLNGKTYATPANGIRFSDTARLNPLAPEGATIGSVIALLRQSGCGSADLRGEEMVAGRAAYVVTVTHTFKTGCGDSLQALIQASPSPAERSDPASKPTLEARVREKQAAAATETAARGPEKAPAGARVEPSPTASTHVVKSDPSAVQTNSTGAKPDSARGQSEPVVVKPVDPAQQAELDRLLSRPLTDTFWIDKQTFVQLKSELNAGPKGAVFYEVTSVTYDVSAPASTFDYAPPAGVMVVSSPAEVKQLLAASK